MELSKVTEILPQELEALLRHDAADDAAPRALSALATVAPATGTEVPRWNNGSLERLDQRKSGI